MKEIHLPVLVHSCRIKMNAVPVENLERRERYIEIKKTRKVRNYGRPEHGKLGDAIVLEEREEVISVTYFRLSNRCRCRNYTSNYSADQFIANGKAMRTFKVLASGIVKDENQIWMPIVRERVPRIDLISRADIERAFTGSGKKSQFYVFNTVSRRFELKPPPPGTSLGAWLKEAAQEEVAEKRFQKKFREYIDMSHDIFATGRQQLFAPFRPDPWEGRLLFPFGPDMRTQGGHS